jgi:hypothetical protein
VALPNQIEYSEDKEYDCWDQCDYIRVLIEDDSGIEVSYVGKKVPRVVLMR